MGLFYFALRLKIWINVWFSVLFEHVVDTHHHTRIQVVEGRVGLKVGHHAHQSHVVWTRDADKCHQIKSRRRIRCQRTCHLLQAGILFKVANSISHINTAFFALTIPWNCQLRWITSMRSAINTRGEWWIGTRNAVWMAHFRRVWIYIVKITLFDTMIVWKIESFDAGQTSIIITRLTLWGTQFTRCLDCSWQELSVVAEWTQGKTLTSHETSVCFAKYASVCSQTIAGKTVPYALHAKWS